MERQIEIGDFAEINNELFRIIKIDGDIIIDFHDEPIKLLYDGEWKFPVSIKYPNFSLKKVFFRSGIFPLEDYITSIQILNNLDDNSLQSACQTNSTLANICNSNSLWIARIEKYFPDAPTILENATSKELYFLLKDVKLDKLYVSNILKRGHIDFLKLMKWIKPIDILIGDQEKANLAAEYNYVDVLKHMKNKFEKIKKSNFKRNLESPIPGSPILESPILPDQYGANNAAGNNSVDALIWMKDNGLPLPDQEGANWAAYNNSINALNWMQNNHILPDQDGANWAAENNSINALNWMKNNHILPNKSGALYAASNNSVDALIWMKDKFEELNFPLKLGINKLFLSDQLGANLAAENESIDVLNWMKNNKFPLPDRKTYEYVLKNNKKKSIEWIEKNIPEYKIN